MEIVLRRWALSDLDNMVKYANNFNIAKYLTNQFPHPYTYEDGKNYIEMVMMDDPLKVFAIEVDGEAVGSIGIFPQSDIHSKNAEISYWLAEDFWGRGIMTEAVRQIVKYGFDTFDVNRIFARPFGINKGSQRVLEKAGFTLEARFEKTLCKYDEYMDELIYAIRKD